MIVALFPNFSKPNAKDLAIEIRDFLVAKNIKVLAEDDFAEELGASPLSSEKPSAIDFMISMGGDGSILRLLHRHPQIHAPVIGVNLGSLGFLADIPQSNIFPSLEGIFSGASTANIQDRIIMEGHTEKGKSCFAVNEMVIHRGKNPCLIDLAIYVDGSYLNTFSADGIIISTPSGSTAYSLAAGGPILTPELEAFVITPICPHTISNRPIVLMPKSEIKIQYLNEYSPVEIIYDGICDMEMSTKETFSITPASRRFKLVSLTSIDYFSTLRTKLGWTGTLKI